MRTAERASEHVDGFAGDVAVRRQVRCRQAAAEELSQSARIDDGAREEMRAGLLPLLEHGDGNVTQAFSDVGVLLEQLAEADRTREPSRPPADDDHADLDALLRRVAGSLDRVGCAERGWKVARPGHGDYPRARASSVSFGTI